MTAKKSKALTIAKGTAPVANTAPVNRGSNDVVYNEYVANLMLLRTQMMKKLMDPRRDLDEECGYPKTINRETFRLLYDREPLAARAVGVMPDEAWFDDPEVYEDEDAETETDFEAAFSLLLKKHNLYHYLFRADEVSGIGSFGLLLFGINDGKKLSEPVDGVTDDGEVQSKSTRKERKLLFIRVFDESMVDVASYVVDSKSPRYGYPEFYNIKFVDPTSSNMQLAQPTTVDVQVHWSRVVHLADNCTTSEVFGNSRLLCCYNRIYDAQKVVAGSAEMFWKGGFMGVSLETQPGMEDIKIDVNATRDQMELFMNGLQRYLMTKGMSAKSLAPQVSSPEAHWKILVQSICLKLKCPYRIFMGSEEARLAANEDTKAWNGRVMQRNRRYTEPKVLRPVVDRLRQYGVLPPLSTKEDGQDYSVEWPNRNEVSETERIANASKITEAMAKYVQGGVAQLVPELEFLTVVLGYDQDEAQAIMQAAEQRIAEEEKAQGELEKQLGIKLDPKTGQPFPAQPGDQQMKQEMHKAKLDQMSKPIPPGKPPVRNAGKKRRKKPKMKKVSSGY